MNWLTLSKWILNDETIQITTPQIEESVIPENSNAADTSQEETGDNLFTDENILDAYRMVCTYIEDLDINASISLETFVEEYDKHQYKTIDDYCKSYYDILSPNEDVLPYVSIDDSEIQYTELAAVNIGQTYMDSDVQPGNVYYYRVAAYDSLKTTAKGGAVKLHPTYVEMPSVISGASAKKKWCSSEYHKVDKRPWCWEL